MSPIDSPEDFRAEMAWRHRQYEIGAKQMNETILDSRNLTNDERLARLEEKVFGLENTVAELILAIGDATPRTHE